MNVTDSNNYGSVVRYECGEGYQIDGVPSTYCKDKTWKHWDARPTCTGTCMRCVALTDLVNSYVYGVCYPDRLTCTGTFMTYVTLTYLLDSYVYDVC